MRIGRVVGRVTLSVTFDTLAGGALIIVAVQDRFALAGQSRKTGEHVVVFDTLGAGAGDLIAFSESREAVMPFYPEKRVPIDAYNSAILDSLMLDSEK